jgi:hypothetical protein
MNPDALILSELGIVVVLSSFSRLIFYLLQKKRTLSQRQFTQTVLLSLKNAVGARGWGAVSAEPRRSMNGFHSFTHSVSILKYRILRQAQGEREFSMLKEAKKMRLQAHFLVIKCELRSKIPKCRI